MTYLSFRWKLRSIFRWICCFIGFHKPYYKYRERSTEEKAARNAIPQTPETFLSNAPEHLGWHCIRCDMFLGWKCRNDGKSDYWFKIEIPRK